MRSRGSGSWRGRRSQAGRDWGLRRPACLMPSPHPPHPANAAPSLPPDSGTNPASATPSFAPRLPPRGAVSTLERTEGGDLRTKATAGHRPQSSCPRSTRAAATCPPSGDPTQGTETDQSATAPGHFRSVPKRPPAARTDARRFLRPAPPGALTEPDAPLAPPAPASSAGSSRRLENYISHNPKVWPLRLRSPNARDVRTR